MSERVDTSMFGILARGSQAQPGALLLTDGALVVPLKKKHAGADQTCARIGADGSSGIESEDVLEADFWDVSAVAKIEPIGEFRIHKGHASGPQLGLSAAGAWMIGVQYGHDQPPRFAWFGLDGEVLGAQQRLVVFSSWRLVVPNTSSGAPYTAFELTSRTPATAIAHNALTGIKR